MVDREALVGITPRTAVTSISTSMVELQSLHYGARIHVYHVVSLSGDLEVDAGDASR